MDKKIVMMVHSDAGVGKSRLLDTAPGPRLILDVEMGTDWTPSPKVPWDPAGPLPTAMPDGSPITTDTSVVVVVRDFNTMLQVYDWLSIGNHYFESVCIDSLTEVQKRCKDAIGGTGQFSENMWGQLLVQMEVLIRNMRDLKKHPTKPVNLFISAISAFKDERWRADVQGALIRNLPGFNDVMAYMYASPAEDGSGRVERKLLIQPYGKWDAKDRTDILTQRFGNVITASTGYDVNCDLVCICDTINGRR